MHRRFKNIKSNIPPDSGLCIFPANRVRHLYAAAIALLLILFFCCGRPRLNPLDPKNPNSQAVFTVVVDYRYDSLPVPTITFLAHAPEKSPFLTIWSIDTNVNGIVDIIDTVDQNDSFAWNIPPLWGRYCIAAVRYISPDGSSGTGSITIDQPWVVYDTLNSEIPHNSIYALAVDSGNTKWISTQNGGLAEFSGDVWKAHNSATEYFGKGNVTGLAVDIAKSTWAARKSFYEVKAGVVTKVIGGLYRYNENTWVSWSDSAISCVAVDPRGEYVWYGTTSAGLRRGTIRAGGITWTDIDKSNPALPNDNIRTMLVDTRRRIWLGLTPVALNPLLPGITTGGLVRMNTDGTNITTFNTQNSPLPGEIITAFTEGIDSTLWIGTATGLVQISNTTGAGSWTIFTKTTSRLPNNAISGLATGIDGSIWVATASGLVRIPLSGPWSVYTTSNSGLPTNFVRCVVVDGQHRLWIGTSSGLVKHYFLY